MVTDPERKRSHHWVHFVRHVFGRNRFSIRHRRFVRASDLMIVRRLSQGVLRRERIRQHPLTNRIRRNPVSRRQIAERLFRHRLGGAKTQHDVERDFLRRCTASSPNWSRAASWNEFPCRSSFSWGGAT